MESNKFLKIKTIFFNAPGNPSRLKRAAYLFFSTILGILLSLIAYAFIEIGYLRWAGSQNLVVSFYGNCALPLTMRGAFLVFGAVGGFFLGRVWWRKVYIERIWAKKYPIK